MKKIFLSLLVCLLALTAQAQKGRVGLGVNLGFAPCIESHMDVTNFQLGARFQYGLTNPLRLSVDLDYGCKSKEVDVFGLSANLHYLCPVARDVRVYPLVGVGYGHIGGFGVNRCLVNAGLGVEFKLSRSWSAGAEVKYQYMKDFQRLPVAFTLTYKI